MDVEIGLEIKVGVESNGKMSINPSRRTLARARAARWFGLALLLVIGRPLWAQDILLSDFEESNYRWLPGGVWTAAGTSFGAGPAQGTLPNQQTVDGYFGKGLVNSYLVLDSATGTLTSPFFTIQRKFIKFLIGGGSYRGEGGYGGETRMDLLVGGRVVRHAAGPGAWEHLDWEQWEVGEFAGRSAQIQVIDTATNSWGHINVDQIIQSDDALTNGVITPINRYLNFPVKSSNPAHTLALLVNGLAVQEFNIHLGTGSDHDFYAFVDLSAYQGATVIARVDSTNATSGQSADFIQSASPVTATPFYQETLRPIYHFTARRGFLNDPNGLVYDKGEYHLSFQHNPYDLVVGNQNWGNAVSPDLVHWLELPEAIYGDALGQAWSGSSVIDVNNTAGFGAQALVSFYTSAGGHDNNNLMSQGQRFTQSLAYSLDFGRTFTKYTNNPVVYNVAGDNRDPKVIWYAPGHKWVMVFWLQNNDYGFFSSTDLKHWTQTSTFAFPNVIEVPELFQLPLDGNTNESRWIFYAGAGHYYVGNFDGNAFSAEYGPYCIRGGNSFAAGQTFNDMPVADGRRILMANATGNFPDMPFNAAMDFPVELTLRTTGNTPLIYVNPVREISLLRMSTNSWRSGPMLPGSNILAGATGEACELDARFQPGTATQIAIDLCGTPLIYDNIGRQITCEGITQPLAPINGLVHLRMLADRGMVEIYGNDGLVYMPMSVPPVAGSQPISAVASGSGANVVSLSLFRLGSAWGFPIVAPQPLINQVTFGSNGFGLQWLSAVPTNLVVQWVAGLGDGWQTIATLATANGGVGFVDTNALRLSMSSGFYRILSETQ